MTKNYAVKMSDEAAGIICAHNGNGGIGGAIANREQCIARRASEGKTSPRAEALLAELIQLNIDGGMGATGEKIQTIQYGDIMYVARQMCLDKSL